MNKKRNNTKKKTSSSQVSITSINNTSISTPNISTIHNNKNKVSLFKSKTFSEKNATKIKNSSKNKLILSNSLNKKKRSSIPYRKNDNKIFFKRKLRNKNDINDNSNILNNTLESKVSQESKKSSFRSLDNYKMNQFRENCVNLFISKYKIETTPNKNKKNNFSFISNDLNLDFYETKKNNIKTIQSKFKSTRKTRNYTINNSSKLNLHSVSSFNAAKISWSKEKKENIEKNKSNKILNSIQKSNIKKIKFRSNKSFYYKDKKLNINRGKFVNYKHFSPLVKNKITKIEKLIPNENYLKNKLKISNTNTPTKINEKSNNSKIIEKTTSSKKFYSNNINENIINKKNEKILNVNNYNISNLPIIAINNKNKNELIKNSKNNNINNNYKNNQIIQINKSEEIKNNDIKRKISNSFQDINHVLENNSNLNDFTINNLRLTKKINDNLEGLIDNSHCVYCLKRTIEPITLFCEHELCLSCAEEIISLYKFTHTANFEVKSLKCPKCKIKSDIINNDLKNMLRLNWFPSHPKVGAEQKNSEGEQKIIEKKIQLCEICPNSKYIRDLAEFECLNCDIILCYECRIRHLSNPRHQDHKIVPYTKIMQEKVELSLCEKHREPTKLFCETCLKSVCVICAQYDKDHENHKINTIKNIMDIQTVELTGNIRVCEDQIKVIEELIGQMIFSKQKLEEEKNLFLDNMIKTFDDLIQIINNKKEEMINYINKLFGSKLDNLENKLKNFKLIKNRYEYYRSMICDIDIDIIDRVIQIKKLNKKILKIENLGLLNPSNFNKSFSQSLFINEPYKETEKILKKYSFLPITDITIDNIIKIFTNSNIIKKEYIFKDFIIILPKIKSGILLYSTLTDGISTITFHKKCDNKGPTLTIVKTVDGHIFGGYNPRSWISQSMYNECDNSFIFSLSDGKSIKPIKCPLIEYKKSMAIYQNEELNSPGWGEVSEADLFISYKNLENSYSNLGRCYKAPKNVEPNCFLAGKPTQWDIDLVEVYAVEILSDEEYYKMMLS